MDERTPAEVMAEMIEERRRADALRAKHEHAVLSVAPVMGIMLLFVFLGWWGDAVTDAARTGSAWDAVLALGYTASLAWIGSWTHRAWKARR